MGEFTSPGVNTFNGDIHLSPRDILVDNPQHPSVMYVTLRQSKIDQFRKGVTLVLGKTDQICPVSSMMSYLVIFGRTIVHLSGWFVSDT